MGRLNQNTSRCRQLLLPSSCFSSWWGHMPGHRIGPSVGHSKTAKGASATRTTQEAAVEEAVALKTAWDPSVTRTTVVVEISVDSLRPSSTTVFKTAREAGATRTTQEAVLEDLEATMVATMEATMEAVLEDLEATMEATMEVDLEDFHLGSS